MIIIYYLYEQARESDYNRRLWAQANYSYSAYYHFKISPDFEAKLRDYNHGALNQLQVLIFDTLGHAKYKFTPQNYLVPSARLIQKLKEEGVYYFKQGDRQYAAIYFKGKHPAYVITSGYDKFGIVRLKNLKDILSLVLLVGISLIFISAVIIVNQVTKPMRRLGMQMQGISENNLRDRIKIRSGRINYEEAQIATHFNAMLDRLERAFELQQSFVHHASHELRTPLASMLLQTEAALRKDKDLTVEEARRTLESLKEDQQEMVELTNSLLLLSQYERTKNSPEWPMVRLDEVLYDTLGMVKRMLPNVNVSLEFAQLPDSDLFLSIQGNDSLIRSAFRNLIKNAWLYSENKSVAITIDATATDIYLHFDNNGKLLTLEEQERLFVPFFRAANSAQKKGFGLGLNIIQRIVSLHSGSIGYFIYNNLNRFTLQFPKPPVSEEVSESDL